jgi:DNA topoisomerase VI subunit A
MLLCSHIFYQHQNLFDKQSQVDDLVDDIAFNMGVSRGDLNIVRLVMYALKCLY